MSAMILAVPTASMGPRSIDRGTHAQQGTRLELVASMGPRSIDRGTGISGMSTQTSQQLQWGRDQLIAELVTVSGVTGNTGALQWGRDQLIAELRRGDGQRRQSDQASMGPRSIDRGTKVAANDTDWLSVLQWGRDQLIAELTGAGGGSGTVTTLQWGRDQLIAELPHGYSLATPHRWLQWGRDQLIAELRLAKALSIPRSRFNGAAIN